MRRRLIGPALLLVLVGAWIVLLRPVALGGATSYVTVVGSSMQPAFDAGSLVIARRADRYAVGDVAVYRVPSGEPASGRLVIHRIVGGSAAAGYRLKGDNRAEPDHWRPKRSEVEGRMLVAVPFAGMPAMLLRNPLVLATLAALLAFLAVGEPRRRKQIDAAPATCEPTVAPPAVPVVYSRRRRLGALAVFAGAGLLALRLLATLSRPSRRRALYS